MADPKEHTIALKVMQLTKPSFFSPPPPLSFDSQPGLCDAPECGLLQLPQNFENIYLGETFTCYICVHNESAAAVVTGLTVKVDLQSAKHRISLPCSWSGEPGMDLSAGATTGGVIAHEVKETDEHILVCTVTYNSPSAEKAEKVYLRKYFKFSVAKPLDVKTKFYNAESDEVYLETQIQNITHLPICMEKVVLEPSESYHSEALDRVVKSTGGGVPDNVLALNPTSAHPCVFDSAVFMAPQAVWQYLFRLRPRCAPGDESGVQLRGLTHVGRLEMVWRSSMGDRGRLQTSQLPRVVPGYGDVRLLVEDSPTSVKLHRQFTLSCRLINCCDRDMDLSLMMELSMLSGLVCIGKLSTRLGTLQPHASLTFSLTFLPTSHGLQTVSGVRLIDNLSGRTYEQDEIAQIYVC